MVSKNTLADKFLCWNGLMLKSPCDEMSVPKCLAKMSGAEISPSPYYTTKSQTIWKHRRLTCLTRYLFLCTSKTIQIPALWGIVWITNRADLISNKQHYKKDAIFRDMSVHVHTFGQSLWPVNWPVNLYTEQIIFVRSKRNWSLFFDRPFFFQLFLVTLWN